MTLVIDYSQWPTAGDVWRRLSLVGITPRGAVAPATNYPWARVQQAVDAAAAQIGRETGRQFVADASDTSRSYNGSGTSEVEVDEMVSLTGVQVLGYQTNPGYTLANAFLFRQQGRPQTLIQLGMGSIPGYASPEASYPFPDYLVFPSGRANLVVTGRFGFAAAIPADLWNAVLGAATSKVVQETVFSGNGRLLEWEEAGTSEKYALASKVDEWESDFASAIKNYKRPAGRKLRLMTPQMI